MTDTPHDPPARRTGAPGFVVSPQDLQRSAQHVAMCAAELRSVSGRWSSAVAWAGTEMPEPASGTLLGEVDAALQEMLTARGRQLDDLADGLRAAATSYTGADTNAGAGAGRIGHDLGDHADEPGGRGPR